MATNDTELHYNLVGKTHYGKHSVVFLFVFFFCVCCFKESGKYNKGDWRECFTNLGGGEIKSIMCSLNTYSVSNTVPAAVDAKINKT